MTTHHSPIVLVVTAPRRTTLRVHLTEPLEIGRDSSGLVILDPLVSRQHVRIDPSPDGTVVVADLGSSNGTFVDGALVEGPVIAHAGSRITFGEVEVVVTLAAFGSNVSDTLQVPSGIGVSRSPEQPAVDLTAAGEARGSAGARDPGTLTLMFSDIESSTERALAMGDVAWVDLLKRHNRLVSTHVAAHRGRVVKSQGDGFMVTFRSVRQALLCAMGIQRDLARWAEVSPDEAIRVRIGLHTGEVLTDAGGDLFGRHVIQASRIAALAAGAEILVSGVVKQISDARGDVEFEGPRTVELKGIDEVVDVYRVRWSPPAPAGTEPAATSAPSRRDHPG